MQNQLGKYIKISLLCVPIGAVVGVLCFIFTKGLTFVNNFRNSHILYTIPFLCFAGLIIVLLYDRLDNKKTSIKKGMLLVFECGQNKKKDIPLILIPLVCISTWLTNLFGGSCGREGVAVQIGATFSNYFNKYVNHSRSNEIFLLAGIAGGFSAMFQTPIAAIFFALEVVTIGEYKIFALIPIVIESFVAYSVANLLGVQVEKHIVNAINIFDFTLILKIILASVAFAFVGLAFSFLLKKVSSIYGKYVKNKYIGIFISGIILSVLFLSFHYGRYSGSGANLISLSFGENQNGTIFVYDFICKFLLTILTLSAGFQGGEVTPLFTIGATLGFTLGSLLGVDTGLLASLGFISVFASATNTMFCPIMLGIEIFGIHNTPYYIICVLIAYYLNFNNSIYMQNKKLKV